MNQYMNQHPVLDEMENMKRLANPLDEEIKTIQALHNLLNLRINKEFLNKEAYNQKLEEITNQLKL